MRSAVEKSSKYIVEQYNADSYSTCFDNSDNIKFLTIGLKSEAGELYDPLKKVYRESVGVHEVYFNNGIIRSLVLEIGDCFWYLVNTARYLGVINECFSGITNHLDHRLSVNIKYFLNKQIIKLDLSDNNIFEENIEKLEAVCDLISSTAIEFSMMYKEHNILKSFLILEIKSIYVYLVLLCMMIGVDPIYVMQENNAKLHDRKKRNVINGSGGYR